VLRTVPDNLLAQRLMDEAGGPLEPPPEPVTAATPEPDAGQESLAGAGTDAEEPLWASTESLSVPPEPLVPAPGVWKTDAEAATDDGPPAAAAPFETVRLSRDELTAPQDRDPLDDAPPDEDPPADAEWEAGDEDPGREMYTGAGEDDIPYGWEARHDPEAASDEEDDEPVTPEDSSSPEEVWDLAGQDEDDLPAQEPMQVTAADGDEPQAVPAAIDAPPLADAPALTAAISLAAEQEVESPRLNAQEADRLLSLARLYRRQGELDQAAAIYQDLLDGDGGHAEARRELAELCGEGLAEISDEDLIPSTTHLDEEVQPATMESVEDARRRKVAFLRSWLDHIRSQP
jgi:hypothetical protein